VIKRQGRFLVDHDLQGRLSIGIESNHLAECVAEANRRKAYGVFGSPCFRFDEDDLDFLADLPNICRLHFWDIALKNIDGIYQLTKLKHFSVAPKRPGIDFSRLPKLDSAIWFHCDKDTGMGSLKRLRSLRLWRFNPKDKTFAGLSLPASIEELALFWCNPATLAGLPRLPKVTKLEIGRCRNLATIAELPRIMPNLEHLVVSACGRVTDGPATVQHLPALHHAFVRNAVLVSRPPIRKRLLKKV
jgi:hypothetical protein